MTMLVRDEADVIDSQLAFHTAAGVDAFVVMDHGSTDGTTAILERHERSGAVHLIRQESDLPLDGEWRNEMARLAATELGADWVIPSDADEFWWPRGGDLRAVLASVPTRYGVVSCLHRDFPYRPGESPFAERMIARLSLRAPLNVGEGPYQVKMKVAFRADRDVRLEGDRHDVERHTQLRLRDWYAIEVLHFPIRRRERAERQFAAAVRDAGTFDEWLERWTIDDETLQRGLAGGWLVADTRVRDALRELAAGREIADRLRAWSRTDAAYVDDASRLAECDGIVRAETRVDALERRVAALESDLALMGGK